MIRDPAALDCARRILEAACIEQPTDSMVALAATVIQNLVRADELAQDIERKQTVLTLLSGGKDAA